MAQTSQQLLEQLESDRGLYQNQADQKEAEVASQPQESQKMGVMFFSILLILCVFADFIDIMTAGTVGWLVGLFVDAILLIATGLSKAGRKQFKRILVGVVGETLPIPFLAILPFRSFFLIWAFIQSRYELPIQLSLSGHKQTELSE